jgi:hypothetical protein
MADSAAVKRALSRLATDTNTDRVVIENAAAGIDDLDRAATFLDGIGLSQLALAVERQRRVGETGDVAKGEHALCVFRRYRAVATTTDELAHSFRFRRTPESGASGREISQPTLASDVEQPNR